MSISKIDERGVSLIEVLLAALILTLGILAVLALFPFSHLPIGAIEPRHQLSTDTASALYGYERQADVYYVDGNLATSTQDSGLKMLSVIVYYRSAYAGQASQYQLKTLISNPCSC